MKKVWILSTLILSLVLTCGFSMYEPINIEHKDGIYYIKIDGKKAYKRIKFVSSEKLMTNKEAHIAGSAVLTVNTGFFDPENQKTISYIIMDRNTVADPLFNENLLLNPILRQNIEKIINRTEFRIVECDDKYHYEIVPHSTPVDFTCSVVTSAQGGPMILPEMDLEKEFFIVKKEGKVVRESASILHKVARTVIGLKDGDIYILIVTDEHPMDVYEIRDLCKQIGLERAMMFDGGSSTSMNYKSSINVISTGDGGGRMLKSFLIFK